MFDYQNLCVYLQRLNLIIMNNKHVYNYPLAPNHLPLTPIKSLE